MWPVRQGVAVWPLFAHWGRAPGFFEAVTPVLTDHNSRIASFLSGAWEAANRTAMPMSVYVRAKALEAARPG
jgi:hypothetical protein